MFGFLTTSRGDEFRWIQRDFRPPRWRCTEGCQVFLLVMVDFSTTCFRSSHSQRIPIRLLLTLSSLHHVHIQAFWSCLIVMKQYHKVCADAVTLFRRRRRSECCQSSLRLTDSNCFCNRNLQMCCTQTYSRHHEDSSSWFPPFSSRCSFLRPSSFGLWLLISFLFRGVRH